MDVYVCMGGGECACAYATKIFIFQILYIRVWAVCQKKKYSQIQEFHRLLIISAHHPLGSENRSITLQI